MGSESDTQSERENTDESLRLEREKVDQALAEKLTALQETADTVITVARARADEVLAKERTKVDQKMAVSAPGLSAVLDLEQERVREDRAVRKERATADQALDEERAEQVALLAPERKETDSDLLSERTITDQALATRDEFLAVVSHDLRNLLSNVTGYAALIEERVGQASHEAEVSKYAKRIQSAGRHMNRLVGDLLDVASIHSGALTVRKELGDPAAVVNEAMENFQEQASLRNIQLFIQAGESLMPAEFDAARILQVLTNLLSNALKFTSAGGKVALRIELMGDELCFSVTDTGAGVPSHMVETIFDRFLQVGPNDRRGVGLGLYISRCIVQGHGGRIWVESQLGQGSAFRFTIPVQSAA